jgi:hypothetical protein
LPEKLSRQTEVLMAGQAGMALCAVQLADAQLNQLGARHLRTPGDLLTGMLTFDRTEIVSCSSTGLVHREQLIQMGGFDPALSMSADWDLLVRMLLGPGVAYVDEPLCLYRMHDSNMSRHIPVMEHDMVLAFAKAFANPLLPGEIRRKRGIAYGRLYRMLAGSYRNAGERSNAARMLFKGFQRHPALLGELLRRTQTPDSRQAR